jgi:hypothetical protein
MRNNNLTIFLRNNNPDWHVLSQIRMRDNIDERQVSSLVDGYGYFK